MGAVFEKIFEISIQTGFLILAVLLVRLCWKRIPKNVICLLWCMVAVRLILPVSLESRFSLVPDVGKMEQALVQANITESQNPTADVQANMSGEQIGMTEIQDEAAGMQANMSGEQADLTEAESEAAGMQANMSGEQADLTGAENEAAGMQANMSGKQAGMTGAENGSEGVLINILSIVWLTGMAALSIYGVLSYRKVRKTVAESESYEGNIRLCGQIDTPFVLGIWKPYIYLPFTLQEEQMAYILAHERAHIARKDHISKLIGYVLLSIYWFQPLVWVAYICFCKDVELACDEKVIGELGVNEKKAYSKTLLSCSVAKKNYLTNPLAFGELDIRNRIKNVLDYKKPGVWVIGACVVLCVALGVCFLTSPGEDTAIDSENTTDREVSADNPDDGESLTESQQEIVFVPAIPMQESAKELIRTAYEASREVYAKLNTSLDVGNGNLAGQEITLPGYGDGWYEVKEEGFSHIQDIKAYAESVFTETLAQEMFYDMLFAEENPKIVESDGALYTRLYDGPHLEEIKEITLTSYTSEEAGANLAVYDEIQQTTYFLNLRLVCEEGYWYVSRLQYLEDEAKPREEGKLFLMEPLSTDMTIEAGKTVTAIPMNTTVSVDLDGDGVEEMIKAIVSQENDLRFAMPMVRVNDYVFDEEYMSEMVDGYYGENKGGLFFENLDVATWYIFDVDVNDGYKEIAFYEEGPSGDPCTTLLRYENGCLRAIGGFSDEPVERAGELIDVKVLGDGTIYATQGIHIMQTDFAEGLWELQNADSFADARLLLQVRDMYQFGRYDNGDMNIKVHEELQVYMEDSLESEMFVLSQGEEIAFYRYYPATGWIQIVYDNFEKYAWILVNEYGSIYQINEAGESEYLNKDDLLENLSYAG